MGDLPDADDADTVGEAMLSASTVMLSADGSPATTPVRRVSAIARALVDQGLRLGGEQFEFALVQPCE